MGGVLRLPEKQKQGKKTDAALDEHAASEMPKREGVFCGKAKTISR